MRFPDHLELGFFYLVSAASSSSAAMTLCSGCQRRRPAALAPGPALRVAVVNVDLPFAQPRGRASQLTRAVRHFDYGDLRLFDHNGSASPAATDYPLGTGPGSRAPLQMVNNARMFTPRSARQTKQFPRAPGLSSTVTVNSLALAIGIDSLRLQGTRTRHRGRYHPESTNQPGIFFGYR